LIFNNCNFVCFRVVLLYTSNESTCICNSFHFFFLRSESNLHFPHPSFGTYSRCFATHADLHWECESYRSSFGLFLGFFCLFCFLFFYIFSNIMCFVINFSDYTITLWYNDQICKFCFLFCGI
jgi:hypothetical protein